MQFHHIGISVTNIERTIDFYTKFLGMVVDVPVFDLGGPEVESVMGLKNVKCRQCHLSNGNMRLEVFEFSSPNSVPQDLNYSVANRGISHFGIDVPDIDSVYQKMTAAGVHFHAPVTVFHGGVKATYGRDPDGNVFELLEFKRGGSH
jgi:catechol 2,3-dioxygenase-like lactoylglutathione lyase family enzyme